MTVSPQQDGTKVDLLLLRFSITLLLLLLGSSHASQHHQCIHDDDSMAALLHHHGSDWNAPQQYGEGALSAFHGARHHVTHHHGFHVLEVSSLYGPLRVAVSALDLDINGSSCSGFGGTYTAPDFAGAQLACTTSSQVFTADKKQWLLNDIIPAAIANHAQRLSVMRVQGNLSISSTTVCPYFTIPASHVTFGVPNADFVLYVAAGLTNNNVLAWAGACQADQYGRPVVGRMNFNPSSIVNRSNPGFSQSVRVATHELTHALGFSSTIILAQSNLTGQASVRGKPSATVITAPTVVQAAKIFFNCSNLTSVELEDQGGSGTQGSHWERRNHMQELMAGVADRNLYSNLTVGLLHDSGYYLGNFSVTDDDVAMQFARNTGCSYLTQPCVQNGIPSNSRYFCNDTTAAANSRMACTWDFMSIGQCGIASFSSALPSYEQYFPSSGTNVGGTQPLTDYCPFVMGFSNLLCTDATQSSTNDPIFGSTFSSGSRCFATSSLYVNTVTVSQTYDASCLRARCPNGQYIQFRINGSSTQWINCPLDGSSGVVSAPNDFHGSIVCPPASQFCDAQLYTLVTTTTTTTAAPTTTTTAAPTTTTTAAPTTTTTAAPTTSAAPTTTTTTTTTTVVPTPPPTPVPTTAAPPPTANVANNATARFTVRANTSLSALLAALESSMALTPGTSSAWSIFLVSNATGAANAVLDISFRSRLERDGAVAAVSTNTTISALQAIVGVSFVMPAPATPSPPTSSPSPPASGTTAAPASSSCSFVCPTLTNILILGGIVLVILLTVVAICCYRRSVRIALEKRRESYSDKALGPVRAQAQQQRQQQALVYPQAVPPPPPVPLQQSQHIATAHYASPHPQHVLANNHRQMSNMRRHILDDDFDIL